MAGEDDSDVPWARNFIPALNAADFETPSYVLDLEVLRQNARVIRSVGDRTGATVLLALKGFAAFGCFNELRPYLDGVAASSLNEARLGHEEFGKQVHSYAPAFAPDEFEGIAALSDHVVFNSVAQVERHARQALQHDCALGIRINPEHSEVAVALYDPCAETSRLGVRPGTLPLNLFEATLTGVHFHTLCELGAEPLERTVAAVQREFDGALSRATWVNFGGGHHITRRGYDLDLLCRVIDDFRARYDVDVIIEPGEAVALNAGVLVASVLDVVHADLPIAILDVSAAAHMPDVLEMPYRPEVLGASAVGRRAHDVRLAGSTCLAGDVIGDYSFDRPISVGDRVVLLDMGHYTMVKNTMFNGVALPRIVLYDSADSTVRSTRRFDYGDYRSRLS